MKLFKLKKGKEQDLLDWGRELSGPLKDEAIITLQEENCTRESSYMFKVGDDYYLIGHMEGENLQKPSDRKINQRHRHILEDCIEEEVDLTIVYDLKK